MTIRHAFLSLSLTDAGADQDEKKKEVIIGIVTQIDLLHYISSKEEVARHRSESESVIH